MQGGTSSQSVVAEVVRQVAAEKGVDPEDLETPLFEVIDPDSLEGLFQSETGSVQFEYLGCKVFVTWDGHVEVQELEADGLGAAASESCLS